MSMKMENNQITHVSAEGTAKSYYRRNEKEKDKVYVNSAIGDTLTFFF